MLNGIIAKLASSPKQLFLLDSMGGQIGAVDSWL
jgi:hypothetical protein